MQNMPRTCLMMLEGQYNCVTRALRCIAPSAHMPNATKIAALRAAILVKELRS